MFQEINSKIIIDTLNRVSTDYLGSEAVPSTYSTRNWIIARLPIELGDGEVLPQIYLKNRNDGKTALQLSIGYFRIICMNGLIAPGAGYHQRVIHRAGPKLDNFIFDLEQNIRQGIERVLVGFDGFKQDLESVNLTVEHGFNIIGWLPMTTRAKNEAIRFWSFNALRRTEDQGYTAWQLYNLVNELDRRYSRSQNAVLEREKTRVQDITLLTEEVYKDVA